MKEIKSVDVMSMAKVLAGVYGALGLVFGFLGAIFGGSMVAMSEGMGGFAPLLGLGMGLAAIVVTPIVMAIMGFVIGALVALFYNFVIKYTGGLKIDL